MVAIVRLVMNSRYGELLVAVRDQENRVRFLGYDPAIVKTVAYAIAAVLRGHRRRAVHAHRRDHLPGRRRRRAVDRVPGRRRDRRAGHPARAGARRDRGVLGGDVACRSRSRRSGSTSRARCSSSSSRSCPTGSRRSVGCSVAGRSEPRARGSGPRARRPRTLRDTLMSDEMPHDRRTPDRRGVAGPRRARAGDRRRRRPVQARLPGDPGPARGVRRVRRRGGRRPHRDAGRPAVPHRTQRRRQDHDRRRHHRAGAAPPGRSGSAASSCVGQAVAQGRPRRASVGRSRRPACSTS